jgi:hypothetical protein
MRDRPGLADTDEQYRQTTIAVSNIALASELLGARNRTGVPENLRCAATYLFRAVIPAPNTTPWGNSIQASPVTPKVTPKMSGCPRSSAIVSERHFRSIRVRHTCFSGVLTRMPSLSDHCRSSPIIAN